mmetsp:Transcript_1666/g.4530  ORF Transcript_1666/g.4530 Transcript_1666/m.4530 type:complete len:92 (-) Transcript_1666:1017-1292(-)
MVFSAKICHEERPSSRTLFTGDYALQSLVVLLVNSGTASPKYMLLSYRDPFAQRIMHKKEGTVRSAPQQELPEQVPCRTLAEREGAVLNAL